MKPPLQNDDTCCLCGKKASKVQMTTRKYRGLSLPVAAALCAGCYRRKDRDEFLKAYIERIFSASTIQ